MKRLLLPLGLAALIAQPPGRIGPADGDRSTSRLTLDQAQQLAAVAQPRAVGRPARARRHRRRPCSRPARWRNPELTRHRRGHAVARRARRPRPIDFPIELGGKRAARVTAAERARDLAQCTSWRDVQRHAARGRRRAPTSRVVVAQERVKLAGDSARLAGAAPTPSASGSRPARSRRSTRRARASTRPTPSSSSPKRRPNCRPHARRWPRLWGDTGAGILARWTAPPRSAARAPAGAELADAKSMRRLDCWPAASRSTAQGAGRRRTQQGRARRRRQRGRQARQRTAASRRPSSAFRSRCRCSTATRARSTRPPSVPTRHATSTRPRASACCTDSARPPTRLSTAQAALAVAARHRAARRAAGLRRLDDRLRGGQVRLPRRHRRAALPAPGARALPEHAGRRLSGRDHHRPPARSVTEHSHGNFQEQTASRWRSSSLVGIVAGAARAHDRTPEDRRRARAADAAARRHQRRRSRPKAPARTEHEVREVKLDRGAESKAADITLRRRPARAASRLPRSSRARCASTRTAPPTSCRAWPAWPRPSPPTSARRVEQGPGAGRHRQHGAVRATQRAADRAAPPRRRAARRTSARSKLWQDKISAEQDYLQAQTALQEADIALQNARAEAGRGGRGRGRAQRRGAQPLRDPRAVRRHDRREAPGARRGRQGGREHLHALRPAHRCGPSSRCRPKDLADRARRPEGHGLLVGVRQQGRWHRVATWARCSASRRAPRARE